MIVVGGTYRELCKYPKRNNLYGSGLKAACALSHHIKNLQFVTAAAEVEQQELNAITAGYGIKLSLEKRPDPMGFSYFTPLDKPHIYGIGPDKVHLKVSGKEVLCFGMIEADTTIKAEKIVLDPQNPKNTKIDRQQFQCSSFAVVLNKHEARELTGNDKIEKSAVEIFKNYNAEVVVIKCGAQGAYVATKKEKKWIGVFPSKSIYPIGSGDIFSAFFSLGWMKKKMNPVAAAVFASKAVSTWTENPDIFHLLTIKNIEMKSIELVNAKAKIYLAGPFFNLGQNWMIEAAKAGIQNLGAEVFSPLHEVGRGGDEVAKLDLDGVDKCSSVLALLDGLDSGTIFEVGYAIAKGISVVGYCENPNHTDLKMLRGSGIPIYNDLSTAIYQSIWAGS
ncbi:PfkB family carbohydrate kinase [Pseudobdellovibrio exovorus]|uniref:Carbohydrate kinase PfkB domain-containing protein n=1 Tax=Pseudobdellovibrio exovorus JSS TaxID=1184267 RepID=M4V7A8_9BACT|nr:PfkB family carbohydrate kinase [Pseudobdellovibrio exovorus]AGH94320.1 hypothetical protein A11Q_100 [Pseudobdellovibrio exovorus JSS]